VKRTFFFLYQFLCLFFHGFLSSQPSISISSTSISSALYTGDRENQNLILSKSGGTLFGFQIKKITKF